MAQPHHYEMLDLSGPPSSASQQHLASADTDEQKTVQSRVSSLTARSEDMHEQTTAQSRASSLTARDPPATPGPIYRYLPTQKWPLLVFALYAAISLFPWIILCLASKRPIGKNTSYSVMVARVSRVERVNVVEEVRQALSRNERFIKAAEVLQSIATLLAIPITSAICSRANAAFMQAGGLRKRMNLQQTAALADQGWLSPQVMVEVTKLGSLPLYFAFGLTLLGSIAQILGPALSHTEDVRVSVANQTSGAVRFLEPHHLLDSKSEVMKTHGDSPYARIVPKLRPLLQTVSGDDLEPLLWALTPNSSIALDYDAISKRPLSTLLQDSRQDDFYFSPVPADFNAGVYPHKQYAPRINSTLEYASISREEWPSQCSSDLAGGFFAEYQQALSSYRNLTLIACVLTDLSTSPWVSTTDRQDITEVLYLYTSEHSTIGGSNNVTSLYKATSRSSLGYFELPSSRNGNRAGPLLDTLPSEDVNVAVGATRNRKRDINNRDSGSSIVTRSIGVYSGSATIPLDILNSGPLSSLVIALFGPGSFMDTRLSNPTAWIKEQPTMDETEFLPNFDCVEHTPMSLFMGARGLSFSNCLLESDFEDEWYIKDQVRAWVSRFRDQYDTQAILRIGLYLANKLWLGNQEIFNLLDGQPSYGGLGTASFDEGIPTSKPTISNAGIIAVSVLLGIHLLGLLVLTLYTVAMKPWTAWLGGEYMVKMGIAYADTLGAADGESQWRQAAQACPGFVGDDRPTDDAGNIRFGALAGLSRKKRMYEGP